MNYRNRGPGKPDNTTHRTKKINTAGLIRILIMLAALLVVVGIAVFANNSDGYGVLYPEGPEHTYIDDYDYEYYSHIHDNDENYENEHYYMDGNIGYAPEYDDGPYYYQGSYYNEYLPETGYEEYHEGGYSGFEPSGGYIGFMPAGFTNTPTGPFDYWNGGTPVMDGAGLESAISAAANPGFTRVIYIGADITMTGNAATRDVIANRDIWIRSTAGNNYVIMSSGANRHFNVSGGGRLTLSNITLSRQIIDVLIPTPPPPPATPPPPINFAPPTGTGGGVAIGATGTLVMENGAVIRHNRAANGGGVDVNGANAVFHMNGGTIRNNQADGGYGGGVRVTGTTSTFHFNGGTIGGDHSTPLENLPFPSSLTHSAADSRTPAGNARPLMPWSNFARSGGGLFVNAGATVIMNRPVGCLCINNNPVGVGCTCTTSPGTGEIVGNIASDSTDTNAEAWAGGGIRVSGNGTSFRMYGGAIRGNYSGNNGGGVLLRNTGGNTTTNRSVFHFMGGYIEENISVRNRSAGDGGGGGVIIGHFSSFYMYEGATVRGNYARTQGAGVRLRDDSARFIMYGGSIIDNRVISVLTNANGGGAGINLSSASGQAGQPPAVVLYSGLIAYNSTISTSTGLGAGGGGIAINRGDVHIRGAGNVVIRDNVTPGHGGGIVWHDRGYLFTEGANFRTTIGQAASAVVNPANANTGLIYITGNTAGINPDGADQVRHGGGIHIAGFGFNGSNFRINNNTATAQGGGVFTADVVILRDSHINLNTAGTSGGGIHNASEVRLYRSNVNGNNAGTSGGGIHTTDTVHLQQTTINGNTAVTTGGGVHTTNNVTVLGSTIGSMSTCGQVICICVFLGNSAGVDGGGLYVVGGNNSVVTINSHVYQGATTHSFIENNTAERNGGGVYFRGTATGTAAVAAAQTPRVTMYHGYIRGNTARGHVIGAGITQGGGGVFIHGVTGVTGTTHGSAATFTMHNGAISYNTAIRGGGLFMSGAHREVPSTGLNTTQTGFSHGGHFVFHGGEISDNRAVCRSYYHPALGVDGGDGAGVYMDGAVRTGAGVIARLATAHGSQFDMHGGYIENNRAARHGGGVFLDRGQAAQGTSFGAYRARGALFTMNTGHIRGNTAGYGGILAGDGGGVYLDGLTLYDNNTIHDDTVARFYMTSGSIDGNTATRDGGGIFIGGGRRQGTDNTVGNANEARGGRVRIYGTSSISDNTAHRNGGGVFLGGGNRSGSGQGGTAGGGRLYMHDTTSINENRALDGGGIFIGGVTDTTIGASSRTASSAILTMQGQAIIEFNTARHRGGGVHLAGNQLPATTNLSPASPRFVFNAGSVANNTANFGGGFFVGGGWRTDTTDPSQNGVIHGAELHIIGTAVVGPGNRAMCATYFDSQAAEYGGDGGGVYVTGGVRDGGPMGGATGGVLRFGGGGTVQGNIAHRNGGGVVLRPGRDIGSGLNPHTHSHPGALLSMNGGHILENIAGDDGGGLWIPNVCPIYTIVPFFSDIPLAEEFVTRPNEFRNNRRLTNVNISGNTATGNVAAVPPPASPDDYTGFGGGIWLGRGLELYLINSTVVSNNAGRNGGSVFLHAGVVADPGTNTLTIAGGYLSGSAQRGGGVFVSGGVGDVNGATFNMQSNVPAIPGGSAAVSTGPPTIGNPAGSPFARGVATYDGGGVYVQGGTTATNAGTFYMHTGSVGAANADGTRRGSIAHRNGGGLFLGSPQVTGGQFAQFNMPGTASRSFIGNDADGGLITPTPILTQGRGGGIFIPQNYPAITLPANTSINHNHARWGGGVWISPHHNLTMGTGGAIRGNSAVNDGGGIFVSGGPIASVNGATFTMNGGIIGGATAVDANVAHRGGGVFVQHGSTGTTNNHGVFTFNNGDVRGNRAIVAGGGVFVDDGEAMPGSGLAGALVFAEAYARYFEYHGYHIGHFTAYSEYNDYDGFIGYASDEIDYDGYIGYAPAPVGITPFSFGGSGGVFTMAGGHIRYNTVGSSVVDGDGGGVWVANYAYFNANGVTFNNNQAQWGMGGAIFSARHEYRSPLLRVLPGWAGAANTLAYSNILLTGVSNFTNNSASTLETPPTNATAAIASTLFGTTSGGASITHPLNNYDINFIFLDTDVPFTFIKFDDYNNEPLGGAVFELHRRGTNISPGVYNWTLVSTQTSSSVAATLGQVSFVFSSDAVYRITETVLPTVAGATFIMPSGHWYVTVVNSVITNPGGLPSRSTPLQADTPEFIAGVGSLPPRLPNRRHLPDWRRLNYAINIHQPAPDRIIIHPAGAPGITEGPGPSGSGIFNLVVSDPVNGNPPAYVGRTITTLPILVPTLLASPAGQHRIAINRAVSIEAAPGQDIFLRMNVPNSTNTTNNLPWGTPPTTLGRHFIIYPGGNLTLGGVGSGNLILDGNRAAVTGNRGGVGVASVAPASVAQLTMRAGSTIRNCRATEGGGVHLSGNNASFTMYGGTIGGTYTFTPGAGTVVSVAQHNYATTGSGVFVGNGATFTMAQPASGTGGVISGNTNGGAGGGVAVIGNTGVNTVFNMHFGLISGNVSTGGGAGVTNIGSGGGVFVFGTHGIINMHGGTIQHNYTPSWSGGGINLNGGATGTMHSGYIQNNRARISGGGGVAVRYDSTFTMNNGTIRNNASIIGGGVLSYNRGLFTMNNGVIYSNTVHMGGAGIPAFGGGGLAVIANSRGYMHGGTIRDHVVNLPGGLGYGGGVLIGLISGFPGIHQDGVNSFTMTGGYIINNEARYGGGIHLPGGPFIAGGTYNHNRVVMNGGTIRGNDARRYGGGINVIQNGIFNMSAGTIGGMRPGGLLPLDPNPNANTADYGGGVRLTGGAQFNLSGTGAKRIIGNVAEYSGGGVWVALNSHMRMHRTPTPAATNLHVSYNIAGYMGGGIYTMDRGTSPNDYPNPLPTTAGVSTLYLNLTLNADTVFEGNSASFLAIPPNNLLPPSLPLTVLPNIAWNTTTPTLPDMGHHHPINNFDINFRSQLISFQFTKTDNAITPQTGAPLPGAIFQLYRRADAVSPWVSVGLPVTSAANGVVAFNLTPAGQYRIVEVLAPSGYDTPFGYWILDVTVVSGALTVTGVTSHGGNPPFVRHPANTGNWYVGNRPGINLPMSGGFGAAQFAVTGSAIIVVAAVGALAVAFTAKRKRATKAVARYNRTMD